MNNHTLIGIALALALAGSSAASFAQTGNTSSSVDTNVASESDALGARGTTGTMGNTDLGTAGTDNWDTLDQPEVLGTKGDDMVDTTPMDNLGTGTAPTGDLGTTATDGPSTATTEGPGTSSTGELGTAPTTQELGTAAGEMGTSMDDTQTDTVDDYNTGAAGVIEPRENLGAGTTDDMSTSADTMTDDDMATSADTTTTDDMNTTGNSQAVDPGLANPDNSAEELGATEPGLANPDNTETDTWGSDSVSGVQSDVDAGVDG